MPTRTLSTLVAVFRNEADARSAADDLKSNGFDASGIHITSGGQSGPAISEASHHYHHHEGGIKGWFKSLMGENTDDRSYETVATDYESAVAKGNVLLSVDTNENNFEQAAEVLNKHNPADVHREAGVADTIASGPGAHPAANPKRGKEQGGAIPVVREELQVGKRTVLRGGVRVYSRVVEEPVEENVRLRQERVSVDRTPVNREVTGEDLQRGQQKVIEVKEFSEEPVISKTSRVVEEVRVRKDASERDETVRDTLRHTEVEVENLNDSDVRGERAAYAKDTVATDDYETEFRRDYESRYGQTGDGYETYAPGYRYGYEMGNDPRYRGRAFDDVESSLRDDYQGRYPGSTWQRMKDSVRHGWDRVTSHH